MKYDKTVSDMLSPLEHFDNLNDIDLYSDDFRRSEIHKRIVESDAEGLLECIYNGEEVGFQDEKLGCTYYHLIVSRASLFSQAAFLPMVHSLALAGVEVDISDNQGRTPLQFAVERNLSLLVATFIRCGADMTLIDLKRVVSPEMKTIYQLFSPGLWPAVEANDYMTVSRLVSYWCRIRIQRDGLTLISLARQRRSGSVYIVELLEDKRPTLEFVQATLAGDEMRMLDILNNKNIDLKILDMSGVQLNPNLAYNESPVPHSLRWNAACLGHSHLIYMLPDLQHLRRKQTQVSVSSNVINQSMCEGAGCQDPTEQSLANYLQYDSDTGSLNTNPTRQNTDSSVCAVL